MTLYAKIVPEIIESSIWNEPPEIRVVWITMLAKKNHETGYVRGDVRTIARLANVSLETAERALELFQQPDLTSHTTDNDGRRITPAPGGWTILNNAKYTEHGMREDRKEIWREQKRKQRLKAMSTQCPPNVPDISRNTLNSISSSYSFTEGMQGEGFANRPSESEFVAFCTSPSCGILHAEAKDLFLKLDQRGWKDGGGAIVENWKPYIQRMKKYIEQDRHKNKPKKRVVKL
jgi:hypothetical protein